MHEHDACQRVGIDDVDIDSATVRQRGSASDLAEQQVAPGYALAHAEVAEVLDARAARS